MTCWGDATFPSSMLELPNLQGLLDRAYSRRLACRRERAMKEKCWDAAEVRRLPIAAGISSEFSRLLMIRAVIEVT